MSLIHADFLLQSQTARNLYHRYAEHQPIFDYHTHLSAKDIAENRRFHNLFEIWLEGDHYKWRAMRTAGVPELYCTGDAEPYEKFKAWAKTVPHTLRNPLYHWTHLELARYFGIDELLDEETAPEIWEHACKRLRDEDLTAQGILRKFNVRVVCTSDDPTDLLEYHERLESSDCSTRVYPTFRPDRALRTEDAVSFNLWTDKLSRAAGRKLTNFSDFLEALRKRHQDFHDRGCRLSDHGLDVCPADECPESAAAAIFDKIRAGFELTPKESAKFSSYLMIFFGQLDAQKGWAKQLHLGAYRNANQRMLASLGRDTGFDSIGDWPQVERLGTYLNKLHQTDSLPKMIIYNANPADNYAFGTMVGNFQDGAVAGKIQFGGGWWFLDQKEAMEWQLNALSNCGLLSSFIGMVTDSRSFMSYPRHEYFRRVLCNLLGSEVEAGQLPDNEQLVGNMVARICYGNARDYLKLPLPNWPDKQQEAGIGAVASSTATR
jgi:glucuronate isomerase